MQIESADASEREFACGALANIMADDTAVAKVLPLVAKLDIVRKAAKCLGDTELGVCAEAAGVLRCVLVGLFLHKFVKCGYTRGMTSESAIWGGASRSAQGSVVPERHRSGRVRSGRGATRVSVPAPSTTSIVISGLKHDRG